MLCMGGGDYEDDGKDRDTELEVRDHFAGMALQGMITTRDWIANSGDWKDKKTMVKTYAKEAYEFADAMMKERYK